MGRRGPKPKPTALRVFEGTRQKPSSGTEPKPTTSPDPPQAPGWLRQHGLDQWRHLAPLLHATGCLTEIDVGLLAQYCSAWDDFMDAEADIAAHGITAVGSTGNDVVSPAVRVKALAADRIKALSGHFGLSPSARTGLSAPVQDPGRDDLESFKAS